MCRKMSQIKGWSLLSFQSEEVSFCITIWRVKFYLWCSVKLKTVLYINFIFANCTSFPLIRSVCPSIFLPFIPFTTSLFPLAPLSNLSSTPTPHVPVLASCVWRWFICGTHWGPNAVAHTHTTTYTNRCVDIWNTHRHTQVRLQLWYILITVLVRSN